MDLSIPTFTAPTGTWDRNTGAAAVSAWRASRLSQSAWCRQQGISDHRLSYWKCRLGADPGMSTEPTRSAEVIAFSPLVARPEHSGLEVVVGADIRITVHAGSDLVLLRSVVEALR